ncbi:MAG: hypothetical protein KKF48_02925 [Nanoarchaeota archaeon]|nr:hypothetical protein [Nanoarchaeota archaeon]MBU1027976.1 hypothetical protein [Nanoarchaeota archaeon]
MDKQGNTIFTNDIFIAKVTGTESNKTVSIPNHLCEFCGIKKGYLVKVQILDAKPSKEKEEIIINKKNAKPKRTRKKASRI